VALESMLKKFEQIARFATVHGERFTLPRLYKLSNGRAPGKTNNQDVPLIQIRDEEIFLMHNTSDEWFKYLAYNCTMEHRSFVLIHELPQAF
jgi:hypothetical protein